MKYLFVIVIVLVGSGNVFAYEGNDFFMFKNRGTIHLSTKDCKVEYSLELNDYFRIEEFFESTTQFIQNFCDRKYNESVLSCANFEEIVKNTENVRNNNNTNNKKKRSLLRLLKLGGKFVAKATRDTVITVSVSSFVTHLQTSEMEQQFEEMRRKEKELEKYQALLANRLAEFHVRNNNNFYVGTHDEIRERRSVDDKDIIFAENMNAYIEDAIQVTIQHNTQIERLNDIIDGNIKVHFFDIFSYEMFFEDLKVLQGELPINFSFPFEVERNQLDYILDISILSVTYVNNTIEIIVEIPLVSEDKSFLI